MPIRGQNNTIKIIENNTEKLAKDIRINGLEVQISGNNNTVIIELPSNFIKTSIVMNGDNNFCHVKASKHRFIRHTTFGLENGGRIVFGSRISVYKNLNIVAKSGRNVEIGDECMFARDVIIRNDDGHVILDKNTNEVINKPEDIKIANNVWIASRAMILKGTEIKQGCVIGAMSLVNKKFQKENCIIAGNPAKIVKEDIIWQRKNYHMYCEEQGVCN